MTYKFQNKYRIPSARLKNWDYRWNGSHFVTICTEGRNPYFGGIIDDSGTARFIPSEIGNLAKKFWMEIPQHFPFVILDAFVVMPNHIHGIIVIVRSDDDDIEETLHATSLRSTTKNNRMASISPKTGSLSTIVRSYKSVVTKFARQVQPDFAWQSRFHDHIIRNDESFARIQHYINSNIENWGTDKFFRKAKENE